MPFLDTLRLAGRLAGRGLAELLAPTGCVACDVAVSPDTLFCAACAVSVAGTRDRMGAFELEGAVAIAVQRFKFAQRPDLGARLAAAMVAPARALASVHGTPDLVVPVPIHPARLAERGYNQASLLARPLARALGIAFAPRALLRVRNTPMQTSLDRAGRRANLERAFVGRAGANGGEGFRNSTVLVVDDVRTTGSTLRACSAALHEVGVRCVVPLVLACRDGSAV